MKICVYGLWHLGCVTAACLADAGHQVIGLGTDESVVDKLNRAVAPVLEPGLEELIRHGLASTSLSFSTDIEEALEDVDVIWVTFDINLDESENSDVELVRKQVERLFPYIEDHTLLLISSNLPIGATRELQAVFQERFLEKEVHFAYSPENLPVGNAIEGFNHPDRVVAGYDETAARVLFGEIFEPFSVQIEWMSIESAEMTRYALNAFLADSIAFINEIASLCEQIGADAREVERGLKSDSRIGWKAYLGPGAAFSGGSLAHDIRSLEVLGERLSQPTPLISGVEQSNNEHRMWAVRRLDQFLGDLIQKKIAVWGLTYKVGTNVIRRSGAIDICRELAAQGALIQAYDPAIPELPEAYTQFITLASSAVEALQAADALIVYTGWPQFREFEPVVYFQAMQDPLVLDANHFLEEELSGVEGIRYITVGKGI